jgi:predicted nucleic acid-binding protein
MTLCAVLDSTMLVSAFLTPGGSADALIDHAKAGRITGAVAEEILAETAEVLLTAERIRLRYP